MGTELVFWILAMGFSIIVGLWMILPLVGRRDGDDPFADQPSMRVHRAALAEVDRDFASGLLSQEDAEAAKVEIQRRMLKDAGDGTSEGIEGQTTQSRPLIGLAALMLGGVPAAAVAVYLYYGNPGEPDLPLASRDAERQQVQAERATLSAEIQELLHRAQQNPELDRVWIELGAAYREAGDTAEAEGAFRQALERARSPEVLARLGETLINRADGIITPEAKSLLTEALEKAPALPQAAYFLALAKLQEGDPEGALRGWLAMERQVPPGSQWAQILEEAMVQSAIEAGIDLDRVRAQFAETNPPTATPPFASGPSQAEIEAAGQASPEDRQAMIEGMVNRLRDRLEEEPSDVDGWLQLARSYNVMGDQENLRWALEQAVKNGPERVDVQVNYAFSLYSPEDLRDGKPIPQAAVLAMEKALEINPDQVEALLLLGIRDQNTGFYEGAREKWGRILTVVDPSNPLYGAIERRIGELPTQ